MESSETGETFFHPGFMWVIFTQFNYSDFLTLVCKMDDNIAQQISTVFFLFAGFYLKEYVEIIFIYHGSIIVLNVFAYAFDCCNNSCV